MSSTKYSRLPSHFPQRRYKFPALEGPGYFTYDMQPGKYSSMFSYSRMSSGQYTVPSANSSTSLLSVEAQPVSEQSAVYPEHAHVADYVGGQYAVCIVSIVWNTRMAVQ